MACLLACVTLGLVAPLRIRAADATPALVVDAGTIAAKSSPTLYGLMTEEINYSYDGGLYAEMIRNRALNDGLGEPLHWAYYGVNSEGHIALETSQPLNQFITNSLKLEVTRLDANGAAGAGNDGYWGIAARPNTTYHASFYAKGAPGFSGSLHAVIVHSDGTVLASASVKAISSHWQKYEITLKTGKIEPSKDNRFEIQVSKPGTVWLTLVSLFPPTYHNRPNGTRPDIMELLAAMKPTFLRFPGGNYVEGNDLNNYFNWKKTVGDLSQRPGHKSPWSYRSSDGLGLLEFLEWCEDLHMEPVLAVFNGYTLGRGTNNSIPPGPALEPYVQDALDEIEYATGSRSTKWGAQRAKDGHPAPFPLHYVEIGNEDRTGEAYNQRFAQFSDAIKARYSQIQTIATTRIQGRTPDVIDEHFYRAAVSFEADPHHYDGRPRNGTKVFVGEWATREGSPTPNMNAALGDAAWMTGMERNSDLVIMSCYAPLFVNVNPGGMQWTTDLIGYDALSSYGSPSYYAQVMFAQNHGDGILKVTGENIPNTEATQPGRRGGAAQPTMVQALFYDATKDTAKNLVYLKLVNIYGKAMPVQIKVDGVRVNAKGRLTVLSSGSPEDTNSLKEPRKLVPATSEVDGLSSDFTRILPAYSISVLELKVK